MNKFFRNSLLASVFALVAASSYAGQSHTSQSSHSKKGDFKKQLENVKSACKSDMEKFCKEVTPGDGRLASCLDSHGDKLSETCSTSYSNFQESISKRLDKAEVSFRKSCGTDIQKFCSNVPSGGGRILDCLSDHQDGLSNSCKDLQAKIRSKIEMYLG